VCEDGLTVPAGLLADLFEWLGSVFVRSGGFQRIGGSLEREQTILYKGTEPYARETVPRIILIV
jgi:hypothetical protein